MRCRDFVRVLTCCGALGWAASAERPRKNPSRSDLRSTRWNSRRRVAKLSVDSLGKGARRVLCCGRITTPPGRCLQAKGSREAIYSLPDASGRPAPAWHLSSRIVPDSAFATRRRSAKVPPRTLTFRQKLNYATLLGVVKPGERKTALPAVLHLPDMGSFRITCNRPGQKLDYDARRYVKRPLCRVGFPAATKEQPVVEYRWEVAAIIRRSPASRRPSLRRLSAGTF